MKVLQVSAFRFAWPEIAFDCTSQPLWSKVDRVEQLVPLYNARQDAKRVFTRSRKSFRRIVTMARGAVSQVSKLLWT